MPWRVAGKLSNKLSGFDVDDRVAQHGRSGGLDHVVVTAPNLADGTAWVESIVGVSPQAGGEHPRMGTHNALLRLGDSVYLEVISPNSDAEQPLRARWFELDLLTPAASPRLAAWVARTDDVQSTVRRCGYAFGPVEPMSRGRLSWLITIPPDGGLPGGGVIPMLIEWKDDGHPASGLPDQGCRLLELELFSPAPSSLSELLDCLGLRLDVKVRELRAGEHPYLVAQIETPHGRRSLSGRID